MDLLFHIGVLCGIKLFLQATEMSFIKAAKLKTPCNNSPNTRKKKERKKEILRFSRGNNIWTFAENKNAPKALMELDSINFESVCTAYRSAVQKKKCRLIKEEIVEGLLAYRCPVILYSNKMLTHILNSMLLNCQK